MGSVVALLWAIVLALQVPALSTAIARKVLESAVPSGAEATVGRVALKGLGAVEIGEFALTRAPGDTAVAIERLGVRFSSLALLRRRIVVHELLIERPLVTLLHPNDSTWTFVPADEEKTKPDREGRSAWEVHLAEANVRGGALRAIRGDGVADRIDALEIAALRADFAGSTSVAVESVRAELHPADPVAGTGRLDIAGASWRDARLDLGSLSLRTLRSRVEGRGTIAPADPRAHSDFHLDIAPLALADLEPFVAGLAGGTLHGRVEARSNAGGALDFTVRVATGDSGRVALDGAWSRPSGLRARGSLESVDPRSLLSAAPEGDVNASIDVAMEGVDLSRLAGHASLVVRETTIGERLIDEARITADVRDGRAEVLLGAAATGVRVDAAATVGFTREVVDVELRLASAEVGSMRIDGGRIVARWKDETLEADIDLEAGGGRLAARVEGTPLADRAELTVPTATLRSLDLARLNEKLPKTNLGASLSGAVAWGGDEPLDARGEVSLAPSSVGQTAITGGRLGVTAADTLVALRGEIESQAGRAELDVIANLTARPASYEVRRVGFEALDLAQLGGKWSTSLNGSLRGSARGTDPATIVAEGELQLSASRVQRAELRGGTVAFEGGEGRWTGVVDLDVAAGRVEASGSAMLTGERAVDATVRLQLPELGALLGDSTRAFLAARIDASARGATRATLTGSAHVRVDSLAWRDVRADSVRIDVSAADGVASLDTLRVPSNLARVTGSGRVPLVSERDARALEPANLRIEAALGSLQPLETSLGMTALSAKDASALFTVTGPADSLALALRAHVDAFLVNTTKIVGLDARADGIASAEKGLHHGLAEVDLLRLGLPSTTVDSTRVSARWEQGERLAISARARVDDRRTAHLATSLDRSGERPVLEVGEFVFQVDEDRWTLAKPALVRYGGGFDVEGFELTASNQRIAIDASMAEGELTSAQVAIEKFRVETVADLVGFDALGGTLSANVEVNGVGAARRGTARMSFEAKSKHGSGVVDATAEIEGTRATIDGGITQAEGRSLAFEGVVPFDPAGSLEVQLTAQAFGVGVLETFLPEGSPRDLEGTLDANVRIAGELRSPRLEGTAALSNARVFVPATGRAYEGIHVGLTMDGGIARVDHARVRSGSGAVEIEGAVELGTGTIGEYELTVALDRFHALSTELVDAVVSGELDVRGTVTAPAISGSLTIEHADVFLGGAVASGDHEDVILDDADYQELEDYFGYPVRRVTERTGPAFESIALDLTVLAQRDTWLRQSINPELVVQLTGEARLAKEPGSELRMVGELEAIPARSHVQQFGRRLNVREGTVVFRGPVEETRVDIAATYEVPSKLDNEPEAVIVLQLSGQPGDLDVALSSEPPMDNADVLSYLATGRPAARSFDVASSEGGGVLTRGGNLALDQVTGLLESFAVDRVGLDVVEIRREGLDSATLVAGRFVSPSLYLGLQEPVALGGSEESAQDKESTQVEVELQALRWLLLNVQSGQSALELFLRARHGY